MPSVTPKFCFLLFITVLVSLIVLLLTYDPFGGLRVADKKIAGRLEPVLKHFVYANQMNNVENRTYNLNASDSLILNNNLSAWIPVQDRLALLYTAHYDDRPTKPLVRVIAQLRCNMVSEGFLCLLTFASNVTQLVEART